MSWTQVLSPGKSFSFFSTLKADYNQSPSHSRTYTDSTALSLYPLTPADRFDSQWCHVTVLNRLWFVFVMADFNESRNRSEYISQGSLPRVHWTQHRVQVLWEVCAGAGDKHLSQSHLTPVLWWGCIDSSYRSCKRKSVGVCGKRKSIYLYIHASKKLRCYFIKKKIHSKMQVFAKWK